MSETALFSFQIGLKGQVSKCWKIFVFNFDWYVEILLRKVVVLFIVK